MAAGAELRPLTDRILDRLPGRRRTWIVAWALVPWVNFAANLLLDTKGATWDQDRALVVVNYAALSFAIALTLWGTRRIARRVTRLVAETAMVCEGCTTKDFREMNDAVVPMVASAVTAVAFGAAGAVDEEIGSGALRGTTWFVLGVPLWTFLSTYAALQRGLDRLGRERLRPALHDPTLGLRPLGDVAFLGLWILLLGLVPVVLTGRPDAVGVGLGLLVVVGGVAGFFLSLWRLHRQMVAFKAAEVELAGSLYAEAYEPVRSARTLEVLEQQRNLLSAADGLEKRARAIHDWPIDQGTFARVITIASSVTAVILASLILGLVGL